MKKRNAYAFILAAAIPLLILLAMTVKPLATLIYGREILLQAQAVDHGDSFRGDYVSLEYKISTLPKDLLPDNVAKYRGNPVKNLTLYASLRSEGRFYVIDSVSENKPSNGLYLKGIVRYYDYSNLPDSVYIEYTLDKYFVTQGSGSGFQAASGQDELTAKAKVLDGYAILTGVQVSNLK